jgi:hypothetical protein
MAASRGIKLAHRKKTLKAVKTSTKLVQPITPVGSIETEKVREKVKVPAKVEVL